MPRLSSQVTGTGRILAPSTVPGKVQTFERGAQPRLPLHTRYASLAPDDRAHCLKENLHTICTRSPSRLHPRELSPVNGGQGLPGESVPWPGCGMPAEVPRVRVVLARGLAAGGPRRDCAAISAR